MANAVCKRVAICEPCRAISIGSTGQRVYTCPTCGETLEARLMVVRELPQPGEKTCDHKFVDSHFCLKCGFTP